MWLRLLTVVLLCDAHTVTICCVRKCDVTASVTVCLCCVMIDDDDVTVCGKKNINFFQNNRIKNKTKNPWKKKREQEGGAGEKIIKCAAYRETLFFLFFVNCFCKHRISDFFFRSWKKKQKTKQFSAFLGLVHQENKRWNVLWCWEQQRTRYIHCFFLISSWRKTTKKKTVTAQGGFFVFYLDQVPFIFIMERNAATESKQIMFHKISTEKDESAGTL